MNKKLVFKTDRFKKNRGGYSRWLLLRCEKCQSHLFVYQKDGPGILKRLYLDRIMLPAGLKPTKSLACRHCQAVLGVSSVYQKENRPAYRLFAGAVEKGLIKEKDLATINFG